MLGNLTPELSVTNVVYFILHIPSFALVSAVLYNPELDILGKRATDVIAAPTQTVTGFMEGT